mgnify:CR=1 FL=1
MATTPKIRTGRYTTFVVSLFSVLILTALGVAQFIGSSDAVTFSVIEALAIMTGAIALELEIFFEGKRKGIPLIHDRTGDLTVMDLVGAVLGLGLLVTGVTSLAGALVGTAVIGMPPSLQGVSILLGAVLLGQEIFKE